MKRKFLAGLLSLCMIFSLMPMGVFAAGNVAKIGDFEYATLKEAINAVGEGDVVIELLDNATLDYDAREAYGTDATTSLTINGNGKVLTLNQINSDWSSFGLKNSGAKIVLNNMTIEKTGYGDTSGAWNTHAIIISTYVEMNSVTVNNAVAVQDGAKLDKVTINEANEYYGLWIRADGQSVTVTNSEINATNNGRGIKIADQYVNSETAKVNLVVENTKFNTAKKAAVVVSSTEGADIKATNVDISNVAADNTNFAWVDEDAKYAPSAGKLTVSGGSAVVEGATGPAVATVNGVNFSKIADAVAAANGAEVTLLKETTEKITLPANTVLNLNLNNNRLNGYILAKEAGTSVEIKNGEIVNDDSSESAVEAAVKLTLTNVNITSARHAVRVDGANANATINGGTYVVKDYVSGNTQHAVNVSGNGATVVIENGTFTGPKGTTADSGSAVNVQANSTVTIKGGNFSGGMNNSNPVTSTLSVAGTLKVSGGTFDIDPTAYLETGYEVIADGTNFKVGLHAPYAVAEDPATCTEKGTAAHEKCDFCGRLFVNGTEKTAAELVINEKPHTPAADPAVAPGCTTTGLTAGEHCSVCGTVLTAQQTVAAKGHSFGGWYTVKEPVCHDAGYEARMCACGETESRALNATSHNFDVNGVCAICGHTKAEVAAAKAAASASRTNPNTGVHF